MGLDLRAISQSIAVRIRLERIGEIDVDLFAVRQRIPVAVGLTRVSVI